MLPSASAIPASMATTVFAMENEVIRCSGVRSYW